MGLSNFDTQAEGVLPILLMNTIFSVVLIKNLLKSMLQIVGSYGYSIDFEDEEGPTDEVKMIENRGLVGKVSVVRLGSVSEGGSCSVCLCRFEDEEEVSELSCKHFFHKRCLDKWFENKRRTCPLCRTMF